jgi:hypothetical protein
MNRLISLRTPGHLFVAVALLVSFEGVSYARTTSQSLRTTLETSAAASAGSARTTEVSVVHTTSEDGVARIRICHISKHPRDGVPATEHACPLIIAEADGVIPASGITLAN